jgi:hypothetical protein
MKRLASDVIRELEGRISKLERQSSKKEPQWITWAIEVLLESRETRVDSRSELKTNRDGNVWRYWGPRKDTIIVSTDRNDYLIYESDDVKTEINREMMEDFLNEMTVAEVIEQMPWTEDVLSSVGRLAYGDIEEWSEKWAKQPFEGMDDDELIELAGLEDEAEEYEEEIELLTPKMDPILNNGMPNPVYSGNAEIMVFDYNNLLNELPERALTKLVSEKEEEIKEGLTDYPLEYLTEDMSWTKEQVYEAMGHLERDERKEAVNQLQAGERDFANLASSGELLRTPLQYRIEEI